jgi:amino acid adenylation domain-containing protein
MDTVPGVSAAQRAELEAYLARVLSRPPDVPPAIPRRAPGGAAPLSFPQQQIWLHARLAPDVPLYNEPLTVRRSGPLDVAALEGALADILRRHEAWRTAFRVHDGQPVQVIQPPPAIALPVVDLRSVARDGREAEAIRLATEDAVRPFDLERGPLLRARLVRLDDEDWRLYLALHHIVHDGVSLFRLLLPELTALYAARTEGRAAPLAAPEIQYADFAAWQRETLTREALAPQLDSWRRRLAGAPVLELPTDRPRPPRQSFRGARHRFALPRALADRVRAFSRHEQVTPFMTLLAAFLTLLHRVSGQDDLVVGTVSAGRKRPEVERLLGYFANPVPVRTDAGGDPTFRELLDRVRDTVLEALAHDDVPFEVLVGELAPERDAGRNPFFQVVLSLEAPSSEAYPGWELTPLDVDTGTAKFDLYLELADRPEGLVGRAEYSTDLFDAATVARMMGHYRTVLEAAVAAPGRRLSALPLLTPGERDEVRRLGRGARAPYPDATSIHRVFEAQARRTPDAVALVAGERRLGYAALNRRANRLARRLGTLGAGPDTLVGVFLDRSPAMVVALLAILKAGAAYVPLDPDYPPPFLAVMLDDAQPVAIVSETRLSGRLPGHATPVVCVDGADPGDPEAGVEDLEVDVEPEALAYVMYTSGSTGRPKGVAVPHRAVLRLVFGQDYARFHADETFLHLASPSFDASTFELWGALLHGGRCVLFPGRLPGVRALGEIIRAEGVTTLWLTAALFNSVIDEAPATLAGLGRILTGGEALSVPHVRRAAAALPDLEIVNGYGPTESTTFACCYRLPGPPAPTARAIPIGRPIANTDVYVVDRHLNLVPVGVPGELLIGGAGLARGYLNRPELTAEKFIADPFGDAPGARLYRTGDLVRWAPDGALEFLGRIDDQVKIRGFRVEPGEVEAALGRHGGVRDVAVVAREDGGDRRLVAYVVPRTPDLPALELRRFLEQALPAHLVPSAFVLMDALPLTRTGKIDRRALPAPAAAPAPARPTTRRDPLQCQLARVWEDLLGVRPVGIDDDFFELGGHSLLAVRLMHEIERLYGTALPPATLYTHSTVARLAGALLREGRDLLAAPMIGLHTDGRERPLFFFHGDINGGGFYCRALARALGRDRPFYALHPLGIDGRPVPPTIEAMADAHLDTVRAVQPHGPYLLGGYCNGGLVAFEVARRLQASGEAVPVVALIAAAADTRFRALGTLARALAPRLGLGPDAPLELLARLRWFNLSHSDGWALVAVARGREVGVDVERCRAELAAGIAERFFAPDEVAALAAQPPPRRAAMFFTLWTLKEAYAKARGAGLGRPLDRFSVRVDDRGRVRLRDRDDATARWSLRTLAPGAGYAGAVAAAGAGWRLRCWTWG